MDTVFGLFQRLPPPLVYALLGAGVALENIFPPIPADTFVLVGGFLSAHGLISAPALYAATLIGNVTSALGVFWVGRAYGPRFFEHGWGRRLLNPHQVQRMGRFYERFGVAAVFFARFLPGLRAVVPASAGVARLAWWKVAPPLVAASAIWYGVLVWLGRTGGEHLGQVETWLEGANLVLLAVALVISGGFAVWWWKTRRRGDPE